MNGKDARYPGRHVVSIVYHVALNSKLGRDIEVGHRAATVDWYNQDDVAHFDNLAFDHKDMLNQFMDKLKH